MSKVKQEQLDELTKPEEGELVDDNLEQVRDEEEEEKEKQKKQPKKIATETKTRPTKPVTPSPSTGEAYREADDLLKKYEGLIEKEEEEVLIDKEDVNQEDVDKALELEEIEISDEQIVKESAEYNKKRNGYFRVESKKEWHKIPMFVKWDNRGHAVYRMKAYKFHDYPYEVRHAVDAIRGEYEDMYKAKQIMDIFRWVRDPAFRDVSRNYVRAQDKWIQVGSKFILHMKTDDLMKAHKDYILLIIDSFMFRQDTRLPNLPIRSSPISVENQSDSEDSQQPSGIQ